MGFLSERREEKEVFGERVVGRKIVLPSVGVLEFLIYFIGFLFAIYALLSIVTSFMLPLFLMVEVGISPFLVIGALLVGLYAMDKGVLL